MKRKIVRTRAELEARIEAWGFLPFFSNSIPGFSIEELADPSIWFSEETEGVWEWKGPIIQSTGCAYGKFAEKKAVFISRDWFPDFANYRRDGYDFDARYDDGLVPFRDKALYDLVEGHGPILSKELKALGNYRKGGNGGFDGIITRLQSQCYVLISDFKYQRDKLGRPYGWGIAEYATPECVMENPFTDQVYQRSPEESYQRLLEQLRRVNPTAEEAALRRFLG